MSEITIGLLGILALFLLLASSMPVGFAMAVVGGFGFALVVNPSAALAVMASDFYDVFSSYSLTVIPLFILMGQVAFHTGISRKLFDAAHCWFGWLHGGLAMATVCACTIFSAICGSGPATAATMAAVALPEMKKHKYSPGFAAGTVAAGGSIGLMTPPSVVFIVYGIMTEQSISKIFIAGILPGILITIIFMLTIAVVCRRNPQVAPACEAVSWKQRFSSLLGVGEILALFLLVMGGMFGGWFTPTEAAAVGAMGSLVLAALCGKLRIRMVMTALSETLRTSCMVMVIVAGATVFGHFLQVTGLPSNMASWLAGLPLPPMGILILILIFYIIAGAFLDALALMLLSIPIFFPVIVGLGFDPIWFGVLVVLVTQIGVISPPVGVNVYVVSGMDRSIPLQDVFKGAMPFLLALLVAAVILLIFPALAIWPTTLIH